MDGTAPDNGFDVLLPLAGPTRERMTHLSPGIRQGPSHYGISASAPPPEAGVIRWHGKQALSTPSVRFSG